MKHKQPYNKLAARRAIILQCLFKSVGGLPPTIGEVVKFVNTWGRGASSNYEVQRMLDELISEGLVVMDYRKWGKMSIRNYSITQAGALALISLVDHLPKQIRDKMAEVFAAAAAAAAAVLLEEKGQGNVSRD